MKATGVLFQTSIPPFLAHLPLLSAINTEPAMGRKLLTRLKASLTTIKWRSRPKSLSANFNWLSSSFSSMAISNQLKRVFRLIDSNGDGKISSLELGEVLLCLGHEESTAAREAEGIVRVVDCDGDGFIDLEEFMQVVHGTSEEELRLAFRVFDADCNGFISARELKRVLVGLGHERCSLRDCRRMIRGVDKNGDGLVDFEEFRSMLMVSGSAF